jgi:hypothetical protein
MRHGRNDITLLSSAIYALDTVVESGVYYLSSIVQDVTLMFRAKFSQHSDRTTWRATLPLRPKTARSAIFSA